MELPWRPHRSFKQLRKHSYGHVSICLCDTLASQAVLVASLLLGAIKVLVISYKALNCIAYLLEGPPTVCPMVSAWPIWIDNISAFQVLSIKQGHLSGPKKHNFSVTVPATWNENVGSNLGWSPDQRLSLLSFWTHAGTHLQGTSLTPEYVHRPWLDPTTLSWDTYICFHLWNEIPSDLNVSYPLGLPKAYKGLAFLPGLGLEWLVYHLKGVSYWWNVWGFAVLVFFLGFY